MSIFKSLRKKLSYKDPVQGDGAFSVAHINYGRSPVFNGTDGVDLARNSRVGSLSLEPSIADVGAELRSFDGTEQGLKKDDSLTLWKSTWLEYVAAFDALAKALPDSVATAYLGRHAVELGFKYALLIRGIKPPMSHKLGELAREVIPDESSADDYLEGIVSFCERYEQYVEGGNVEYFRYPSYKGDVFFAGNRLDVHWLSYNFALVILKLVHHCGLDGELDL